MFSETLKLLALSSILWACCFWTTTVQECPADRKRPYSYDPKLPNGPANWHLKFPQCKGKRQSPINIQTDKLISSGIRQRITYKNYNIPIVNLLAQNNGYRLTIFPKDGVERSLILDNIEYKLHALHFYWGNKTNKGSEHAVNGKRFSMEVHFIHLNSNGSFVAVAGMIEEAKEMNVALDNLLVVKKAYQFKGPKIEGAIARANSDPHKRGRIFLDDLMEDRCPYWRYSGSITFPPCTEGVTWLICRRLKPVTKSQLDELFELYSVKKGSKDKDKCHLVNNYRPIQKKNGRKVYD